MGRNLIQMIADGHLDLPFVSLNFFWKGIEVVVHLFLDDGEGRIVEHALAGAVQQLKFNDVAVSE